MPILRRIEDPHLVYTEAFRHLKVDGAPPVVVTSRLKGLTSQYYPMRAFISALAAVLLIIDIYCARPWRQTVLVREFWNIPLLITWPLAWPFARSILFNINHNLTSADDTLPRPIRFLVRLGFRFVLFDGANSVTRFPIALRSAFLTPLFPSVAQPIIRAGKGPPFRVGLMGSINSIEEESLQFFYQLSRIASAENVVLCYGARDLLPKQLARIDGIEIVDTRSRASFCTYLASLQIAIFVATPQSYFYRHSGSVMDAVTAGIVPVAPNFPVLQSQISNPLPVGVAYDGAGSLPGAVDSAISLLGTLSTNRSKWHDARKSIDIAAVQKP